MQPDPHPPAPAAAATDLPAATAHAIQHLHVARDRLTEAIATSSDVLATSEAVRACAYDLLARTQQSARTSPTP